MRYLRRYKDCSVKDVIDHRLESQFYQSNLLGGKQTLSPMWQELANEIKQSLDDIAIDLRDDGYNVSIIAAQRASYSTDKYMITMNISLGMKPPSYVTHIPFAVKDVAPIFRRVESYLATQDLVNRYDYYIHKQPWTFCVGKYDSLDEIISYTVDAVSIRIFL